MKADPGSSLIGLAYQILEPLSGRPEGVRDLPTGFNEPCYYQIKCGDRQIPAVIDLSKRLKLCLDTNGDGSFSQERCLTATRVRASKAGTGYWLFGPVSLVSEDGPSKAESRFYVISYGPDAPRSMLLYPASYKTGKLSLGGRALRVALVDVDHDGRFRSTLSLPLGTRWRAPGCDLFALDLTQDGKFEFSLVGQSEVMPLGRMVPVGGAYYAIDIAADGMSLALSKAEPQFGSLVIEPNDTSAFLRLWSDAADQYLPGGRQWQIPAGRYKAIHAVIERRDPSGDVWTFWSNVSQSSEYGYVRVGPLDFFEIRPGETTSIRIGPPFVVKAVVQQTSQGSVLIDAVLKGSAGEEYLMNFQRNHRRPPERAFKIIDEEGNVLVADTFKYG
jgi:hypothetical protein